MFHPSESGATVSSAVQVAHPLTLPPKNQEILRMFLLGDYSAIRNMISRLAAQGIAEANHWTPLQPTGRADEYISVHTRRMAPEPR